MPWPLLCEIAWTKWGSTIKVWDRQRHSDKFASTSRACLEVWCSRGWQFYCPQKLPRIQASDWCHRGVVIVYYCSPWGQPIRGLDSGEFLGTMELLSSPPTPNFQTHYIFLKVSLLYFIPLWGTRTFVHRNYSAAMSFTIFPRFLACKNQCHASQRITYPHPCMYLSSTRRMFYKGHLIRATLLTKKCFIKLLQSYVN